MIYTINLRGSFSLLVFYTPAAYLVFTETPEISRIHVHIQSAITFEFLFFKILLQRENAQPYRFSFGPGKIFMRNNICSMMTYRYRFVRQKQSMVEQ